MRKWLPTLLALAAALPIVLSGTAGCGGGGGGGTSGGSTGGAVTLVPSSLTIGPNGEAYLVARKGGLAVDVSWSATAGFVTPTSQGIGVYTGPASGTATVTATAITGGGSDSTSVTVDPALCTIRGRVVTDQGGLGVSGVIVDFKNGNTTIASATTVSGGYFSVGVPTTVNRMHVRNSSIPFGFYKQYTYNAKRYTTLDSTCSATVPAQSAGSNFSLVTNIVLPATVGPPPPPPNGCS